MKKSESSGWTKKRLAVELSHLQGFEQVFVELEQYATPSEIAADWLWNAVWLEDIEGKRVLDAACGPGILGCGALLMGADTVYFVDKDADVLRIAQHNVEKLTQAYFLGKSESSCCDVGMFDQKVDTVIQNPPFGTQVRHHDKVFLEKAFSVGKVVYSMHKATTASFVEAMARDRGFDITHVWSYKFRIGQTLPWHRKKAYEVSVGVWRMVKKR